MTAINQSASYGIELSELRQILAVARTYPSGDNCQPFHFHWNGQSLDIEYDVARGEHRLNPRHLISWMTLGFLLEALDLAASQLGFSTEAILPPTISDFQTTPLLGKTRVFFQRTNRKEDPLAQALLQRCTDRRDFSTKPISQESVKALYASCAAQNDQSKVTLSLITQPYPAELKKTIFAADALIWNDSRIFGDLLHWMRLSDSDPASACDGMPWRTLGIRPSERRLLLRLKKYPFLRRLIPPISLRLKSRRILAKQLKYSGAIGLFSVSSIDSTSLIGCGRSAMRSWLSLNSTGNGFHPLTLASFAPFAGQLKAWPAEMNQRYQKLFDQAPEILKKSFSIEQGMIPLWMFRTGAVSELPMELRTPRRPLEELLKID
jgi:hypothetical protein